MRIDYLSHFSNLRNNPSSPEAQEAVRTLVKDKLSKVIAEFRDFETPRLVEAWNNVRHIKETPYKIEAALSHLLIERKNALKYNQKLIEVLEILGDDKDILFDWLDASSDKEELLSHIHSLLTLDVEQKHLIFRMSPENRLPLLRFLEKELGTMRPYEKEMILDLLYDVPHEEWKKTLRCLKTLLASSPNSDITCAILDEATTCEGEDQLQVLMNACLWHFFVDSPEFIPAIIGLVVNMDHSECFSISSHARLLLGKTKGEQMFTMLKFLSNYSKEDRDSWIKQAAEDLKNIPPKQKLYYLKKYLFIEMVLGFFQTSPVEIKPCKTPLKHIR